MKTFLCGFLIALSINSYAQIAFDYPPLNYSTAPLKNDIEQLRANLEEGKTKLEFDEKFGYLPAILEALKIPKASQVLVFSKTSFQKELIDKENPRALYFNEESYIGWVNKSDTLEFTAVDENVGAVFYTLEQKKTEFPKIVRNNDDCLDCHSSARTQSVPGVMIRSVFLDKTDSLKTNVVNHRTSFDERWGSWYVTGNSGKMKHLGNIINSKGQKQKHENINTLKEYFNTEDYLLDQSDIVALMVLEHQVHMSNLITRANFRTRVTVHRQAAINRRNNKDENYISEYVMEEIKRNCDSVVKYMLFSEETKLINPISGSPEFVKQFKKNAVSDSKGRSLKDLNCNTRLFEYPLSYMIYTEQFEALPQVAKEYILKRLFDILTGKDKSADFKHLNNEMKKNILEILRETKKNLPDYWH